MPPDIIVPLDVPGESRRKYLENYQLMTHDSGRLMLFAGDQKVEHLNDDFFGPGIDEQDGTRNICFRSLHKRISAFSRASPA